MNERDSSMKHHGMQVQAGPDGSDGRRFRAMLAAGCVALSFPAVEALAQSGPYPTRPIRMIVPLPAGGVASINYAPGPAQRYSTGITAVVSSATTCFTKTTSGGLTAFIGGAVQ